MSAPRRGEPEYWEYVYKTKVYGINGSTGHCIRKWPPTSETWSFSCYHNSKLGTFHCHKWSDILRYAEEHIRECKSTESSKPETQGPRTTKDSGMEPVKTTNATSDSTWLLDVVGHSLKWFG